MIFIFAFVSLDCSHAMLCLSTITGAVTIERQPNEKSDIARKMALYNFLNYHYWWDMPFSFWCASFYDNSSLLGDETVHQDGGLIGDGRWTYHS